MKRQDIFIEVDELLQRIDDPNLRIFDTIILFFTKNGDKTARDTYLEGHIPHAAFFDHEQMSVRDALYGFTILPETEIGKQVGELGISADSEVILYASNMLACATRAWWVLRYAGHNNVRILNGGLDAWEEAGGKLETGGNTYAPTTFEGTPRPEMFANKDEVQAAINDASVNVEYSLPVQIYGNVYIPSSSFLPANRLLFGDSILEAGSLVSDEELAALVSLDAQYQRTITYCGGGIAATLNAVAHLIGGNPNVAVYDGSLAEWMGEGLPIEKAEAVKS